MASLPFFATDRHHTPHWILKKIADLTDKAKRRKDSSNVLYACFEARNLLEMLSTSKLQCSVPAVDREEIMIAVKPQHGIKGVDKELKALGLKTQEFMSLVSELEGHKFPVYNFNESDKIHHKLSQYVHTYTVEHDDMIFGSEYIRKGLLIIAEAVAFIEYNLIYFPDTQTLGIVNADMTNLPAWGVALLNDWKSGKIKDKATLKDAIVKESQKFIDDQKAEKELSVE